MRRSRRGWIALGAFVLLFSLWLHWRLRDMAFDDMWIHLRIARNLLETGHAWFNPGERVMASSSPLWTVVMAVMLVPRWPILLPVLEALLWWSAVVLAFRVAWCSFREMHATVRGSLSSLSALLAGILLVSSSVGQMETPLAMVFALGAWLAALQESRAALPLLALAAVTRLELLPVWLIASVATMLRRRSGWRTALPELGAGTGIVLVAMGWTLLQFHVLLPNSMRAKQISYDFTFAETARQFVQPRLMDRAAATALLLLVLLFVWQWRHSTSHAVRHARTLAFAALLAGLLVVVEYGTRRTVVFEWYRPLYMMPLTLGVLLSIPQLPVSIPLRVIWMMLQIGFVAHLAATPALLFARSIHAAVVPTVAVKSRMDRGDYARVQNYLQVGAVLDRMCSGQQLMASEIGALGWAFHGDVNDGFGIASPAALAYQPLRSGAPKGGIPAEYLLRSAPDIVVSYTVMAVELWHDPRVDPMYDRITLPTSPRSHRGGPLDHDWRSSPSLDVWLRRGRPCDTDAVKQALRAQVD